MIKHGKLIIIIILMIVSSIFFSSIPINSQNNVEIPVGSIFALNNNSNVGNIERQSAFFMAIDDINNDDSILPDYRLVGHSRDSNSNPEMGVNVATELAELGVVAIIGPSTSVVSEKVSIEVSKSYKLPLISPSATSAKLSDKSNHPYFTRVAISDLFQSRAVIDLISHFKWPLVSTIASRDTYGMGNVQPIAQTISGTSVGLNTFEEQARLANIVVDRQSFISSNFSGFDNALDNIKAGNAKVIFVNLIANTGVRVLETAQSKQMTWKEGYVWIGSDGVSQTEIFTAVPHISEIVQGMLGISPVLGIEPLLAEFLDKWETCNSQNIIDYPGCGDRNPNIYSTYTYDAVNFLAKALDEMIKEGKNPSNGDQLLNYLYKTKYNGITGLIDLNEFGSRQGIYSIVNYQKSQFVSIGSWTEADGIEVYGKIYWDGDPLGKNTKIPIGVDRLNGYYLVNIMMSLMVIQAVQHKVKRFQAKKAQ